MIVDPGFSTFSSGGMPPASQLERIWVTNGGNGSGGWVWHDPRTRRVWWDETRQGPFPGTSGTTTTPGATGPTGFTPGGPTGPTSTGHEAPTGGVGPAAISVRPVAQPPTPVDAKATLNALKAKTNRDDFLKDARPALARIAQGWEIPPEEKKQRLVAAANEANELGPEQKAWLLALIDIQEGPISDAYKALDRRYWDPAKTVYNQVAKNHVEWLEKRDEDLVNLMTKNGAWRQITKRSAVETIDRIRKAQEKGDKATVAGAVATYFFLLAPQQRNVLAADLATKLRDITTRMNQMSPSEVEYATLYEKYRVMIALARGAVAFVPSSPGAEQLRTYLPGDPQYAQLFSGIINQRSAASARLKQLVFDAVKAQGDELVVDPAKRQELLDFIRAQGYDADGLLTFAAGLRAHPEWADYGERLALALATPDANGNFVLATSDTATGEGPGHGAVMIPRGSGNGRVRRAHLQAAINAWDQPTGSGGPLSHRHVYRPVNHLTDLRPASATQPVRVWRYDGTSLVAYDMSPDGTLTPVTGSGGPALRFTFEDLAGFARLSPADLEQEQTRLKNAFDKIKASPQLTAAREALAKLSGAAAQNGVALGAFTPALEGIAEAKLKMGTRGTSPIQILELRTTGGSILQIEWPHPVTENPAWVTQHLKLGQPGNWTVNRRTTDRPASGTTGRTQTVEELSSSGTPKSVTNLEWPPSGEVKVKGTEVVHGADGRPTHEVEFRTTESGGTRRTEVRTRPTGGTWSGWRAITQPNFPVGSGRTFVTGSAPPASTTSSAAQLFTRHCGSCHGPGGSALSIADIARRYRGNPAGIVSYAKNPRASDPSRLMPSRAGVGDANLLAIANWILAQ